MTTSGNVQTCVRLNFRLRRIESYDSLGGVDPAMLAMLLHFAQDLCTNRCKQERSEQIMKGHLSRPASGLNRDEQVGFLPPVGHSFQGTWRNC